MSRYRQRHCIFKFILFFLSFWSSPLYSSKDILRKIVGQDFPPAIFLDMYTVHYMRTIDAMINYDGNFHNKLVGFTYKNFAFGTFFDTMYNRAVLIGYNRLWFRKEYHNRISVGFGYRLSLVSSSSYYNKNISSSSFWKISPILPVPSILFMTDILSSYGLEVQFTPATIHASFYFLI